MAKKSTPIEALSELNLLVRVSPYPWGGANENAATCEQLCLFIETGSNMAAIADGIAAKYVLDGNLGAAEGWHAIAAQQREMLKKHCSECKDNGCACCKEGGSNYDACNASSAESGPLVG